MVRSRWKWVLLGVVLLLVGAELGLNALKAPVALVKIVNRGDDPILNLVLTSGPGRSGLDRIDPQADGRLPDDRLWEESACLEIQSIEQSRDGFRSLRLRRP